MTRQALEVVGGFRPPVPSGGDYVLGQFMMRWGHRIHRVPNSRIATDYRDSWRGYLRRWGRWHKNVLIHGQGLAGWPDVAPVAAGFGLYSGMLLLFGITPFFGRTAFIASLTILSIASIKRLRKIAYGVRSPVPWTLRSCWLAYPAIRVLTCSRCSSLYTMSSPPRDGHNGNV
jgi:hypothetical protein